jgi:hypothetical protein
MCFDDKLDDNPLKASVDEYADDLPTFIEEFGVVFNRMITERNPTGHQELDNLGSASSGGGGGGGGTRPPRGGGGGGGGGDTRPPRGGGGGGDGTRPPRGGGRGGRDGGGRPAGPRPPRNLRSV